MYLGNKPATDQTYLSLKSQQITGDGTATYSLDYDVAVPEDLAVFVNEIRQNPNTYSVDNQEITFGGTISASETCYIVYLSRAVGTVSPPTNSVGSSKIIDGAVTTNKIADSAVTYAKSTGFGKVAQIVQSTSSTEFATTSTSFSGTGHSVSITPSSTSSKVLILGRGQLNTTYNSTWCYWTIFRGSTNLSGEDDGFGGLYHQGGDVHIPVSFDYLDSPATTSSTTYEINIRSHNGNNVKYLQNQPHKGTLIAMEILG